MLFPFFPLPQAVMNFATPLWEAFTALLVIAMCVCLALAVVALVSSATRENYDKDTARIGLGFLGAAALIFFFHLWLILIAAAVFVLYLLVYWVIWRFLIKNILAAI